MEALAKIFREGGIFTYFIAGVSAFAVAVILERIYFYLIKCRLNAKALLTQITTLIRSDKAEEARKLCAANKSPLSQILESAIYHFLEGESDQEIQNAVDEVALRELPKINKRLHYLSMFANVSTLLGLMGTIQGLMTAFASLASADASQKATLLAGAIAEIMGTTFLGLCVAIPCMIVFSMLSSKAGTIIEEIDESTVRLMNFLFAYRRNK